MGLFGGLFQRGNRARAGHHTVVTCRCGMWYELTWRTGAELLLSKAEFAVRCARCGEHVYSRGYVCGDTCGDPARYPETGGA